MTKPPRPLGSRPRKQRRAYQKARFSILPCRTMTRAQRREMLIRWLEKYGVKNW